MNQMPHALLATEELYPSSDGQPLPEGGYQFDSIAYAVTALRTYYHGKAYGCVGGDQFVYYEPGNANRRVAPDVFVALGARSGIRDVYLLWQEAPLDFVLEVASSSTHEYDSGAKRGLYAALGAKEYWQYDPGGLFLDPVLQGFRLEGGAYRSLPEAVWHEDGLRLGSDVLGLDLCALERGLRFRDPVKGEYLRSHDELEAERAAAEAARRQLEARVAELEARLRASADAE